jgi:tape measure domain-containing protein
MSINIGILDIGVAFTGDTEGLQKAASDAQQGIDRFGTFTSKSMRQMREDTKGVENALSRLSTGLKGAVIGSSLAVGLIKLKNTVFEVSDSLIQAQVQLDKLNNGFKFGAGGAAGGARELAFVREEANRLGLELGGAANMYMKMVAAARGTIMEGAKTRETFIGISEAATVMGMSGEQYERAMQAVVQMMSKGKVQAEELRGQLGEHLPGAFSIAARSMGVTEAELNKLLETGQVMSADFLPKFAAQLRNELGGSVEDATKSMQASLNRFETSWLTFKQNVAQSGAGDFLGGVAKAASNDLAVMSTAMENARLSGKGFLGQMNDVAGLVIARSSIGFVEGAAETLNSTINLLTGNIFGLRENIDLMPLSMKSAAQQAMALDDRLAGALARQKELGEYKPGKAWLNHEIYQTQQLVNELQAAKRARDELSRPAGTGASEVRYSAMVDAETLKKMQAQGAEYAKLMTELATPTEKFTAAVFEAKEKLGALYTPEVEARLREKYIKPIKQAAEATDVFARALESVQEKSMHLNTNYTETITAFNKGLKDGRFGAVGSAEAFDKYSIAVNALVQQQPIYREALKKSQEAEKERIKDLNEYYNRIAKDIAQQEEKNITLRNEVEMIGLSTDAQHRLTLGRLDAAIAAESLAMAEASMHEASVAELALMQRRIDLLKEQRTLTDLKQDKESAAESAKHAAEEWKRAAEQIEQSLTDSLMRGFESGKGFAQNLRDTVVNLFKTLVLRPVISAVVSPVAGAITGSLGLSGAANAGTSALGSAASSLGVGTLFGGASLSSLGSAFGEGFMATLGGSSLSGGSAAGLLAGGAAPGTSMAGTLGAAAPYAAAAVAALAAVGAFRTTKTVGGGLTGTLGEGDITAYDLKRKSGSLFGGPSYSVSDKGVSEQSAALQDAYSAMRTATAGMAEQLGVGSESIKAFTVRLGNDLIHPDTGGYGIKLDGLTAEQSAAKVQAALAAANDELARLVLGATDYATKNETASQTLARLSTSLTTVNSISDTLGWSLQAVSLAGGDAASTLADKFGGLDAMKTSAASYYEAFYSEAERTAISTRQLTKQLSDLGVTLPETRDAYRELVDGAMASGNQQLAADLIKLSGAYADITVASDKAAESLSNTASQFATLADYQFAQDMAKTAIGKAIASSANRKIPAFANGGYHAGGLALVGEHGAEVVDFSSPARIYTADQTRSMFSGESGRGDVSGSMSAVVAELQNLQSLISRLIDTNGAENNAIAEFSSRTARLLERFDDIGLPVINARTGEKLTVVVG